MRLIEEYLALIVAALIFLLVSTVCYICIQSYRVNSNEKFVSKPVS